VYLHGCNQTPQDAAVGTRWNTVGEAKGMIVVYPEQPAGFTSNSNAAHCWNFFDPTQQNRGQGEPAIIAGITRHVISTWKVDPKRVYVIGASAGAAEAEVLGAAYPDLYASIGSVAGCPYAACSDVTGALTYRAMGSNARQVPAFIAHGTSDEVTVYPLGEAEVQQWLGADDLADDGLLNGSVSRIPASFENFGFTTPPNPGSGDPCIVPVAGPYDRVPCAGGVAGFQGTYPYTIRHYNDATGHSLLDFYTIYGLGHAYPGGNPSGSFVDPLGPDVTTAAANFFMAHPKP
ncbi:MAG: extracellular catalytic domain type 1 short-chain-length polyhydroxyalkanoate depolymerase, partial [Candidatus Dormibacteria bacterium]